MLLAGEGYRLTDLPVNPSIVMVCIYMYSGKGHWKHDILKVW
ncbi:hypothetical protein [Bacillus sp. ISL-4]|nr:hypothetical protein [Bacillus sp. ISL-4]